MAKRSKKIVNRLPFSAQGRIAFLTPCVGHLTLGGAAIKTVLN